MPRRLSPRSTVILGLALVGVRLARTCRAALRHVLLAAAFGVLLALPIASILVPSVPIVQMPISTGKIASSPAVPFSRGLASTADRVSAVSGRQAKSLSSRISMPVLLLAAWAAGVVLFLLPVFVGVWQVRALLRSGRPWRQGQSLAQKLRENVPIHRRIEVLLHATVSGPGSCGVLRPMIVLPMDAQTWHEDDLHRTIVHELEHVRRRDWASQCLARAVCAFYWFHPLVWIAWRRLILEAERACDDAVLQRADATAYAHQLVALAGRMSTAPNRALTTLASRTDLAARVVAVLDNRQQRGQAGTFSLVLTGLVSVLLVTTISPLRIATAAQSQASAQTFSGSLIDPLGRTLPDTRLTLWNTSTQKVIDARSDQAGHFEFREIPAGEYQLQVFEFGSQGQISVAPGQQLNRDIALVMPGVDDTVTVYSNDVPAALPPLPGPLPPPSKTAQTSPGHADLSRCAQASMFCRVTPPVQIARAQPAYPGSERETRVAGTVAVEGLVGTDGLVKDLHTVSPANPDFARATSDALRRWQFTPIRLDDVPVEMSIRVTAHFVVR